MKRQKRMTRAEKIAASALLKKGVVTDGRVIKKLPPGTYTVMGDAAVEVSRRELAMHFGGTKSGRWSSK